MRVELHFHLLPGVDDGPETVDDSLELARAAVAQGTGTVVATPHVRPDFVTDPWELPALVTELRAVLAAEAVPLTVLCGGEIGHEMVDGSAKPTSSSSRRAPPPGDGYWSKRPSRKSTMTSTPLPRSSAPAASAC